MKNQSLLTKYYEKIKRGNVPNKLVNKNSIGIQYYFYRNKIGK